jgi:hypothetical protein
VRWSGQDARALTTHRVRVEHDGSATAMSACASDCYARSFLPAPSASKMQSRKATGRSPTPAVRAGEKPVKKPLCWRPRLLVGCPEETRTVRWEAYRAWLDDEAHTAIQQREGSKRCIGSPNRRWKGNWPARHAVLVKWLIYSQLRHSAGEPTVSASLSGVSP